MTALAVIAASLLALWLFVRLVARAHDRRLWRSVAEEGARITLDAYRRNCVCTIEGEPFDSSGRVTREIRAREVRKADRRQATRRRDDKRKAALRR